MNFTNYLKAALTRALEDADAGRDHGDLRFFNELCRRGVRRNWEALKPTQFLADYHRCIATIAKKVAVVEKYLACQVKLFRKHNAAKIVADQKAIWKAWEQEKRFLSPKMVAAVIATAELVHHSWGGFKPEYLLLPENPEAESLSEWRDAHAALKRLPMVGEAIAWYLLRNLYGAPVFKPDVHICAIAWHFFGEEESPLDAMSVEVRRVWGHVCRDERFCPVHLGEVDYMLW